MSFFSKKEVKLEPLCRFFYERIILNCVVDGVDINAQIYAALKRALTDTDSNFANIASQEFSDEMVALQFELFALAWLHQFCNRSVYGYALVLQESKDDSGFVQDVFQSIYPAVAQSVFTKTYLKGKNLNNIWEAMEPYNQAIARSTTIGRTPEKAFDRAYLAKVDFSRANLFGLYYERGFDGECVARVLNRLFSEHVWRKGIAAGLILCALCDRLGFGEGFKPSKEAHHQWFMEVNDLYEKFRLSLGKVKMER